MNEMFSNNQNCLWVEKGPQTLYGMIEQNAQCQGKHASLQLLILNKHLYLSGVWLDVSLKTDTKITRV